MMNNGEGVAGYAPNATIMPVRVLNARGSDTWPDVASGIAYAADKGAPGYDIKFGYGRLNVFKALALSPLVFVY